MQDDIDSDYAAAGFNGSLPFGASPALVIIDVVMAYIDPASPLYLGPDNALPQMARLAQAARAKGVPVIFTNIRYAPGGREGGLFYRKVPALKAFDAGSPLGAFPPELTPQPGDHVLGKFYPSIFFGTALAPMLHAMGVDCLLLTGYSTSGCVRASALDSLCHGFAPFVVSDGCADRDARPHEGNLFDMQAKMAEVIDTERAVALIAGV
ncbi:isochorismatase family protein [Sphingobium sufflavum]|uniref:isochorismatase family protein n=1 Tax=Sphingobium sufflavum TaxID=1129547 RepID=UPI001F1826BA|nr:isochorismatase family protein [Sphingobium sufflavum]MCE7796472.1 isochorismatase family protein [Sphingobium sufflavum]